MSKESEQQSIEELIQKKDRLGCVIKQRFELVQNRIGTGEIKEGTNNLDASLRVGMARESVAGSIPRLEVALAQVDEQIKENEYFVELSLLEAKVVKARDLNRKGFLSQEVLESAEKQLTDFKTKAHKDTREQEIAGTSGEQRATEAQRPFQLDQKARDSQRIFEVELIDGRKVGIRGKVKSDVLNKLNEKIRGGLTEVPIELIAQEVFGSTDNHAIHSVYDAVLGLRRDLGQEGIILLKGRIKKGQLARFRFGEIEPKEKKISPPPIFESRLEALEKFAENQDVLIREIIEILGPNQKGQPLLPGRALFSLKRVVNYLAGRVKNEVATERELQVWQKVKEATGLESEKEVVSIFVTDLNSWFALQKEVKPEEIIEAEKEVAEGEVTPLSLEEAAILASVVMNRDGVKMIFAGESIPLVVGEDVKKATQRILSKLKAQGYEFHLSAEEIVDVRKRASEKVGKIIKSDKLSEIFEEHDEDVKEIIYWFLEQDMDKMLGLVAHLLTESPIMESRQGKGQVEANWRAYYVPEEFWPHQQEPKKERRVVERVIDLDSRPEEQKAMDENLQATSETVEGDLELIALERLVEQETTAAVSIANVAVEAGLSWSRMQFEEQKHVDKLPIKKKGFWLAEKDPNWEAHIDSLIDQVLSTGLVRFSGAQFTKFFPRIKMRGQERAISKGLVSPNIDKSLNRSHPEFSREELVVILFIDDLGNGWKSKEARKLQKLVAERIEKKQGSNGK